MPSASFAAHLAASPPVTGPLNFVGLVESFLQSIGGSFLATPEARAALKKTVMDVYDAIALNVGKSNVALGMLFSAFKPAVGALVDGLLSHFTAPPPAPVVVPTIPHPPIGSAP